MNIATLIIPKSEVKTIKLDSTLRQALESMQHNGYTSVPVINESGKYAGTLTEGDLLWTLKTDKGFNDSNIGKIWLEDIAMRIYNEPLGINSSIEMIIKRSLNRNFIPVVDDNKIFIGIVTRKDIIGYCKEKFGTLKHEEKILTPKKNVVHISINTNIEKAIELMEKYRYAAIPVVDKMDRYTETLTEGDILWTLKTDKGIDESNLYRQSLSDIAKKYKNIAAKMSDDFEAIVDLLIKQNFVPMVDENEIFMGVVKRSDIMSYFSKKFTELRK